MYCLININTDELEKKWNIVFNIALLNATFTLWAFEIICMEEEMNNFVFKADLFYFQINNTVRCILIVNKSRKLDFNMIKCVWSTWPLVWKLTGQTPLSQPGHCPMTGHYFKSIKFVINWNSHKQDLQYSF